MADSNHSRDENAQDGPAQDGQGQDVQGHDDAWRANLPEGWEGKQADEWDGEIPIKPIVWSTAAVAISFVIAYFLNLGVLAAHETINVETPSALVEASERYLPPSPLLQSDPEAELEQMLEELDRRLTGYGWTDELDQRVHIPIERGMDLVLARHGAGLGTGPEPPQEEPVDLEAESAASDEAPSDEADEADEAAEAAEAASEEAATEEAASDGPSTSDAAASESSGSAES